MGINQDPGNCQCSWDATCWPGPQLLTLDPSSCPLRDFPEAVCQGIIWLLPALTLRVFPEKLAFRLPLLLGLPI